MIQVIPNTIEEIYELICAYIDRHHNIHKNSAKALASEILRSGTLNSLFNICIDLDPNVPLGQWLVDVGILKDWHDLPYRDELYTMSDYSDMILHDMRMKIHNFDDDDYDVLRI